jgi:gliding motility-associated-like protein
MKRIILTLSIIIAVLHSFSCTYTVSLIDSYGDGWNGNKLTIKVNGSTVLNAVTLSTGYGPATFTFNANTGQTVQMTFDNSGSYDYECSYTITNSFGMIVFSDGQNGSDPVGGSFIANCDFNDDPCTAWSLSLSMQCSYMDGTNTGATNTTSVPAPPCANYNGGDIWYKAIVPGSGIVRIDMDDNSLTDMGMAFYTGTDCNNLTFKSCDDNSSSNGNMPLLVATDLTPGSTLWIRIWDVGGNQTGSFKICGMDNAGPPSCLNTELASDFCNSATPICDFNGYCGNTSSSYTSSEVPTGFCGSVENNSWLSFVASATSATLNVWTSNCSSGDGIQMEIYTTTNCSNFTSVSNCVSDGTMSNFQISTTSPLVVGQTYYLMIDGWGGDVCDYVISANSGVMVVDAISVETGTNQANLCDGQSTQLQASGGSSYSWSPTTGLSNPNIANPIANPIATTTYTVTVTGGACGASDTASVTVFVGGNLSAQYTTTASDCGACDGTATITSVTGGTAPYSYLWNSTPAQTSATATNLCSGTIDITITDAINCSYVDTVIIGNSGNVNAIFSYNNNQCLTGNSFNFTNTGTTGTNVSFLWTFENGTPATSTQENPTGITFSSSGIFNVSLTTTYISCSDINIQSIEVFPQPSFSVSKTDVLCNSNCDGTALVTLNDITLTYTYNWSSGSTSQNATSLCQGIHSVTVTNQHGCSTTSNVTISQPNQLTATITNLQNISCFGLCDGSASVVVTGGSLPYQYNWETGGTTLNETDICAGIWQIDVLDANNCKASAFFTITEPALLTADIDSYTNASCFGLCNGTAQVVTQNGTPPYTYLWSNSNTTDNCNNLCQGWHYVTTTDSHSCSAQDSILINQPTEIVLTMTLIKDANCGQSNGEASVSATGGTFTGNYQYLWNTGSTVTLNQTGGLPEGFAYVTVTDNNSCSEVGMIAINNLEGVIATISSSNNATCFGACDGSATIQMTANGLAPYQYTWSNGQIVPNSPSISNTATALCSGIYTVTMTDANNCSFSTSVTINQPEIVTTNTINSTMVSCNNLCDGYSILQTIGGTSPYTYLWPDGSSQSSSSVLCSGNHVVTITDSHNCHSTYIVTITQPEVLSAAITDYTDVSCFGACDGTATVVANGGTAPYAYVWSGNASVSSTKIGCCAGKHTVTVTDSNGCISTAEITITEPAQLNPSISSSEIPSCNGFCDGTAVVVTSGGTAPYLYIWTNGYIGNNPTDLCYGIHQVTVTDANNCSNSTSILIDQPPFLSATISSKTNVSCYGFADGTASVSPNGGTSPYTFMWPNGITSDYINSLTAGISQVTVTDANGCQNTASVQIAQPGQLKIMINPTELNLCIGQSQTLIATYISGGTLPISSYSWNNGETSQSIIVTAQNTQLYTVQMTDANGCLSNVAKSTIMVYPPISLSIAVSETNICPGDTITINSTITGGNGGPYTCVLDNQFIINPPYKFVPQGEDITIGYPVIATDLCNSPAGIDSFSVSIMALPPNHVYSDTVTGCQPLKVSFIESSPNENQSYAWNFGDDSYSSTSYLKNPIHIYEENGIYDVTLTVTSAQGCKFKKTYEEMIEVYQKPTASFTPDPYTTSIVLPEIHFINTSYLNSLNYWNFGDNSVSNVFSPFHVYEKVGIYPVQLVVESDKGCKDTVSVNVDIKEEFTVYIPSGFTPDNDGINDIFYVLGNGIDPSFFNLSIYNRWGEIVFFTNKFNTDNQIENGWDGRINGQAMAENGVYVWYLKYKDTNGVEHQKSGHISVLR